MAVSPLAAAQSPDWFDLTPEVAADWTLAVAPQGDRLTLTAEAPPPGEPARVLVLYTKRSSASV